MGDIRYKMKKSVRKEAEKLIEKYGMKCTVDYLKDETYASGTWDHIWRLKISVDPTLSEDFIREFEDKLVWWRICWCSKLSESFIREFRDKVDWAYISRYQKFTSSFYEEFKDRIIIISLFKNENMEITIRPKIEEEIGDRIEDKIQSRWEILDL